MVAAVGLELLADRRRRRYLVVAVVPSIIYVAWYLALGRAGVATARDPFTLQALSQVPAFVVEGAGAAAGAITGLGPFIGIGLMVAIVAISGWGLVRGEGLPARVVGCLGGIVVLYVLTGLVRAQLVDDAALYTRYTYLAGALLMVATGALIGPRVVGLTLTPRVRLVAVATGGTVLVLAVAWNLQLLVAGRGAVPRARRAHPSARRRRPRPDFRRPSIPTGR